jgi:hypothetical protein
MLTVVPATMFLPAPMFRSAFALTFTLLPTVFRAEAEAIVPTVSRPRTAKPAM